MASCFVNCYYRGTPLQSIGEAARVKTGASVVYHIPHLETRLEDGMSENTGRENAMLMGEVSQNLSAVVCTVKVNEMFGSYFFVLEPNRQTFYDMLGKVRRCARVYCYCCPQSSDRGGQSPVAAPRHAAGSRAWLASAR